MTASPKATASRGAPARAPLPSFAASSRSCARSRDENITSCPARTHTAPSVPPTLPEPTMPILAFFGPAFAARAARLPSGPSASMTSRAWKNFRRSGFTLVRLLPVRPRADVDHERHLELRHAAHQLGQPLPDLRELGLRHLEH